MPHQRVLILDDQTSSVSTITFTLTDAGLPWVEADSNDSAVQILAKDSEISLVLVRATGKNICAADLCRMIRGSKSLSVLPILVILSETQLSVGAECLLAGANDLLVDPFEPRELRMRAGIVPDEQNRRVDAAHTFAERLPQTLPEPEFFTPAIDPRTMQFGFGQDEHRIRHWEQDPAVTRISLDRVIVCPECDAVPTFRPGCGSCGSAWVEHEVLIHHYACAHVGPEAEFQTKDGLACPKCRLKNLITGSDFELIQGCLKCADCDALFAEPRMIAHCTNCQNRFPASEGRLKDLYGYQVGRSASSAVIPQPNWITAPAQISCASDCRSGSRLTT
ncbi:MAG: hypothetical protein R3C49_17630 [Planctomycetaceae bacterium]